MEKDSKAYVKLSASFDPSLRSEVKEAQKPEENADKNANPHSPKAPSIKDATAVQQEVADLNKKLSAWIFTLPQNKSDFLKKVQADLLKDAE